MFIIIIIVVILTLLLLISGMISLHFHQGSTKIYSHQHNNILGSTNTPYSSNNTMNNNNEEVFYYSKSIGWMESAEIGTLYAF